MTARSFAVALALSVCCERVCAQDVQPPPGFAPLFDGESLAGWKGGSTVDPREITPQQQQEWDAELPRRWRVENGELVSDGSEPHLASHREFEDFEFVIDWKISPRGDSGVYLRGCPQVQLWDPTNAAERRNGADKGSGGLWNNERHERFPVEAADKPAGQWNRMSVRMVGEYVKVVLNGQTVVDNVVLENYYDRKMPVFRRGPIHLQTHGSETRFDNIFVRDIPADEAAEILSQIGGGEEGFTTLFHGKDFTGWIGAVENYEIVDGAIRCKAGHGGNLLTQDEYENFIVRLEFKLPPGGNNGLAIRTPSAEVDAAYEGVELQVLDDNAEQWADLHDYQYHGSAYGLAPAHRGYLHPAGQWNYQEVVVNGDRVEVHLNGTKILDASLTDISKSPRDGREHPGAARRRGRFGFCGHNDPVEFRNIRIKAL